MFKTAKGLAVTTANVLVPGSGVLVGSAFELAKICFVIGQVLSGMENKATTIKSQKENIQRNVESFRWVLELLEGVENQDQLTEGLQKMILKFQAEVKEYERVLNKFTKKSLLKQLVFHNEIDIANDNAMKTKDQIVERLTVEAALDGSARHRSPSNKSSRTLKIERDQRYIELVDSTEVMVEMSNPENQKELLAIIARKGRRDEALMESSSDQVVSVLKEKLWASSSSTVRSDITNLPDWYITEDEIEVNMDDDAILGFGGDAKIYPGTLTDGTPVAVKIFNENVAKSEKNKKKFNSMMKLWQRLSHFTNVCHLYGACYFTAAPFVVMEHCDVGSLDKYLRQVGPNRYNVSLEVLAQAAQGIAKMHSIGIVHGDLKCDNILITGTPARAKICDFDRSFDWIELKNKRLVKGTAAKAGIEITDATRYVAPECVEGKLPNTKTDVYSFGMTIYHALVGRSPYFEITNDEELRGCKLDRELPERDENLITDEAWDLITECCAGAPDRRPAMPKVVEALKALLESEHPGVLSIEPYSPSSSIEWNSPPPPIEEDSELPSIEEDDAAPAIEEDSAINGDSMSPSIEENLVSPLIEEDSVSPAFEENSESIEQYYASTGIEADSASPVIEQYYTSTSIEGDSASASIGEYYASPSSEGDSTAASIEQCYASTSIKQNSASPVINGYSASPAIEALIDTSVDVVSSKTSDQDVVVTVDQEPDVLPALQLMSMDKEPPGQEPDKVNKMTPVNEAKPKSKGFPRSYKIGAAVVLLIVAALATAAGIVFRPTSSDSSSASTQSSTPTPTPTPTTTPTPTPTSGPSKITVSTIVDVQRYLTAVNSTIFWGVAVSYTGTVYISGIREIFTVSSAGEAQLYAGSSTLGGYYDGQRLSAYLNSVYAITVTPDGSIYFCDKNDNKEFVIRKVKGDMVSTISNFTSSVDMGLGIAADSNGNVYATIVGDNTMVKISSSGAVGTVSTGNNSISPSGRMGVAFDTTDNFYITDNHRVMKYTPNGTISVLAGSTTSGFANGLGKDSLFATPMALTVGFDGNLYIADSGNNCIRKLALDTNMVTTYAGVCNTEPDNGKTTTFVSPRSIDVAPDGALYVTDDIARVRKIIAS
ncbi:hypothetical protein V7S43_011730 [Phytophthora oleae]|uniref:Protein kinase domain-containing protein n=1 Tax=Phytophthora oleae TaxID=2107226 RepID=A0ABD3FBL6_9STRA